MDQDRLGGVGIFKLSALLVFPTRRGWLRFGLVLLLTFCCSMASLPAAWAADGALDPGFVMASGPYSGVQIIPEIRGQLGYGAPYQGNNLIFGTFYGLQVGGFTQPNSCIARLTNMGTLDTTFLNNQNLSGEIRGAFIYPHDYPVASLQDKILIWGRFNAFLGGNTFYNSIARLNANGSLDTSFPPLNSYGGAVNSVAVQGGGANGALAGTSDKILVGGYNLKAGSNDSGPTYQLVRLNYDGTPDTGFTHWGAPNGYISGVKIVNDPIFGNNKVRILGTYPKNQDGSGGVYYLLLLNAEAQLPSVSAPLACIGDETVDGPILAIARQSDGQYVIGGQFKNVKNGTGPWLARNRLARFTYNGTTQSWSLDTGYNVGVGPNGVVTQINPMKADPVTPSYDDRMILAGNFDTWNGNPCGYIIRLTTSGAVDGTFTPGTGADNRIMKVNWKDDGTGGWIYGYFRSYNGAGNPRGGVAGLNANGAVNADFSNITAMAGWQGMVYSLATQSDGKIIIGGDFNGVCGKYRGGMARINPNGSLDPSFKGGVDGVVKSVAVAGDGKILLGGTFGQCQSYACTSLARLNPGDSAFDQTFKPNLVGGDNSLNDVYQVLPLSSGQIMVAGDIYNNAGDAPATRLNSDGSLDSAFFNNISHIQNPIPEAQWSWGRRVAVSGSDYLLAGGYATTNNWWGGGFLGRVTSSGLLDTSFYPLSNNHVQTMDAPVDDLLLQPDGKIVVSGWFTHILDGSLNPPARSSVARFNADGSLDPGFTPSLSLPLGANTMTVAAIARQPDGKLLIEEQFLNNQGSNNFNFVSGQAARLRADGSLDPNVSLGALTQGYFGPGGGSSILRMANGKALIGGVFGNYNTVQTWSLVRIFAGPANFNPGYLLLLTN